MLTEIEFEIKKEDYSSQVSLYCPKCKEHIKIESVNDIIQQCLRMLNAEYFKDAKVIRLDDWYTPEVKAKV